MTDPTWTDVVTAIGAAVAGGSSLFVLLQLHLLEQSAQLDLIDRIAHRWDSKTLRCARRLANLRADDLTQYLEKCDRENADEFFTLMALTGFFEEIGILAKKNPTVEDFLKAAYTSPIKWYYGLFEEYIKQAAHNNRAAFENFRYLRQRIGT